MLKFVHKKFNHLPVFKVKAEDIDVLNTPREFYYKFLVKFSLSN